MKHLTILLTLVALCLCFSSQETRGSELLFDEPDVVIQKAPIQKAPTQKAPSPTQKPALNPAQKAADPPVSLRVSSRTVLAARWTFPRVVRPVTRGPRTCRNGRCG